jgi:CRISPR-associated protein Cas1
MAPHIPWLLVSGFGAHIKSTPKKLIIQKKNNSEEYPIENVRHLLLVGGHTIHTSTVSNLVRHGAFVSFFEADGTPVGIIRPYGAPEETAMRKLQEGAQRHRYAIEIAQGSLKSRLVFLEKIEETRSEPLLYEGESEFIHKAYDELEYLIKLDEIRRLNRLTSDMYYEILSRTLSPELGFKRRTVPPQRDVVNSLLSLGYAMLYGNCYVSVLGAYLDPDNGLMHTGKGSLVLDLIDPFKAVMIDEPVFRVVTDSIRPDDYELSSGRCLLSDDCVHLLINVLQTTINIDRINEQVSLLTEALNGRDTFKVLY